MRTTHHFGLFILKITFFFLFSPTLHTQLTPSKDATIRIADFRKKPTDFVIYAAITATREGAVVVLVRGG